MGNSLISESKLMYYPTDEFETYRLLGVLGDIQIDNYVKRYYRESIIGEEKYRELFCYAEDNYIDFNHVLYDYFLNNRDYQTIKKICKIRLGFNNKHSIVIADLFAGKGLWLDCFYTFMDKYVSSNNFITVANELDEERFNVIKKNENISDKFNKSFEELQLPQNSVSLMLFNPPYGSSNGERNVRRYLKMILNRKILYNPEEASDYKTGYMVFVIRKDDFLDSLDIIVKNFDVFTNSIYKANPEEYKKYKQYIFVARLRRFPYSYDNSQDVIDFQNQYNKVKEIIESEPEFNLSVYNTYQMMNYPYIDYTTLKENMTYAENQFKYISKNDGCWKWIKNITELKQLSNDKIVMPKNAKIGEVAMLLASGKINGKMSNHVVVGGTKIVQTEDIKIYKDQDGKNVQEKTVIKMNKPYLNILCNQNGKLTIKELGEEN